MRLMSIDAPDDLYDWPSFSFSPWASAMFVHPRRGLPFEREKMNTQFVDLHAAADFMGHGAIEVNQYQPEVLDIVRRRACPPHFHGFTVSQGRKRLLLAPESGAKRAKKR